MSMEKLERFLNGHEGKKLLEKHSKDEEGLWLVRGEDPNCDWGGYHHNPYLGTVSGRLGDVIKIAVKMDKFWTWGAGGSITKVKVHTVEEIETEHEVKSEIKRLEDRIEELKARLK